MTPRERIAASGAPPEHHLKIWSDGHRIYCEIPGIEGKPPYISAYSYNTRGIDTVMSLLGIHRADYDYKGTIPEGYTARTIVQSPAEAQREVILKRMGIIK